MAIVKLSFTRNRDAAKATVRYIEHRPGRAGARITRPLFGSDGRVSRQEAYGIIDQAAKGSIFFRLAISPDPKGEDTRRDLPLREITEHTMHTLEERSNNKVTWVASIHAEHAPHRHVHVLAVAHGRLDRSDLAALTQTATAVCQHERRQHDQIREGQQQEREREEAEWDRGF